MPTTPLAIISLMKDVIEYFDSKFIPYVIIGGIAVSLLGRPRTTFDIDLIIDHRQLKYDDFYSYLREKEYILSLEDFEEGFSTKGNITIGSGAYTIDLKGIYNKLDRLALEQVIKVKIADDFIININRPELLIVAKLAYAYASEQDFEDAAATYKKTKENGTLDHNYLTIIATEFGVVDRIQFLDQISSGKLTGEQLSDILDNLELVDWL